MKIYPYSGIKTVNLGPLLIAARLIGFISFILFAIAITLMIVAPFLESGVITQDLGSGTTCMDSSSFASILFNRE